PSGDFGRFLRLFFVVERPWSVEVIDSAISYFEGCSSESGFAVFSLLEITVPSTGVVPSWLSDSWALSCLVVLSSVFISLTSYLRVRWDCPMLRAIFGSLLASQSKKASTISTRRMTVFLKSCMVFLFIQLAPLYNCNRTYCAVSCCPVTASCVICHIVSRTV